MTTSTISPEPQMNAENQATWLTPKLQSVFVSEATKNTPDCGTVDSPCTKQSGFGPEDCGTC